MNTDRAMPSKKQQLGLALSHAERDLRVIQAIVLTLLAVLLGYAAYLIYKQDWLGIVFKTGAAKPAERMNLAT